MLERYEISIAGGQARTIRAKSRLEAGVIYCRELGLNYRVYANKLDIRLIDEVSVKGRLRYNAWETRAGRD